MKNFTADQIIFALVLGVIIFGIIIYRCLQFF
jgi:hypothetical protein